MSGELSVQIKYSPDTAPGGGTTRYAYEDAQLPDRPTRITDPDGGERSLQWNRLGQLVRHTDCSGHATEYAYDREGRLIRETNALGQHTHHEYDTAGRRIATVRPDGARIETTLDAHGRPIALTAPAGHHERFDWDAHGRLTTWTNAAGFTQHLAFDAAGRLASLTNENGAQHHFDYDAMNRVIVETGFDGRTQHSTYNRAGELIARTDAGPDRSPDNPLTTRYDYDAAGRLSARHLPATAHAGAWTETYHWRADGQLAAARSPLAQVEFSFDAAGRPCGEAQRHRLPDGYDWHWSVRHRFNARGALEASQLGAAPEARWLTYGPGHLHGLVLDGVSLDFARDALHRETERTVRTQPDAPLAFALDRDYTVLGQLAAQRLEIPAIGTTETRHYGFDALGQLTDIRPSQGPEIHYTYDAAGRLTASRHGATEHTYRFDPAGNRLDSHPGATQSGLARPGADPDPASTWAETVRRRLPDPAFNPLEGSPGSHHGPPSAERWPDNRITALEGTRNRYDAFGNLTERHEPDGTRLELGYDGAHRLVSARRTHPDGTVTEANYAYDPLSRRIAKAVRHPDGHIELTRYGWDGERIGCEQTHATTTTVLYEPGSFVPLLRIAQPTPQPDEAGEGELAAFLAQHGQARIETDAHPDTQIGLYLTDHLGTPLRLLDPQGQTLWQAEPDDWGATSNATGTRQPIRFQGQWEDEESGLYYNRYRYYDPGMGRYVTQDPIGLAGGINIFSYGAGNPIGSIDALGLAGCYVLFPDYPVTYAPGRTSTRLGGHAGVLGYDSSGSTRYYEYGRYAPNSSGVIGEKLPADQGNVRRITIPDLVMGSDGNPTPESLERLKKALSERAGLGTKVELTCDTNADEQKIYRHVSGFANDADRPAYRWYPWSPNHCRTFANDSLNAGR